MLIRFNGSSGGPVWVNPLHVAVVDSSSDGGPVAIVLALPVKARVEVLGTVDEVAMRLNGAAKEPAPAETP